MKPDEAKLGEFFKEVRKAMLEMPKRPPIIVKEGNVVGVKLNSETIEKLSQPNYVKPIDENYINYLMGIKVYRDDTVSKPIYIVEGEIETELGTDIKPSSQTVTILKSQLEHWHELLGISGANTKQIVRNDIKSILGGK